MDMDQLVVDTIKGLAIDGVEKADSGHPGAPMGMANIAAVVWTKFLTVDPDDPTWPDRDRFVLSNGHASMLLYSLLHLSGFPITMEDLEQFRQWGSHTPGHPEIDQARGIETTTGPLGQGFGTAVGMAIAEEHLRSVFGADLVDHRTWVFASDGDLMEGVSAETASLAGHLGLGRLTCFYDDNHITIDGDTAITFTEDVAARFGAVGWHTVSIDGRDRTAIAEAAEEALREVDRPSLVIARTHIGDGAPTKHDTPGVHGTPLGEAELRATKELMGFPVDTPFYVPDGVYGVFTEAMNRGRTRHEEWNRRFAAVDDETKQRWGTYVSPAPIRLDAPAFEGSVATRAAAGKVFDQIAEKAPGFIGGAADLVASTKTKISFSGGFSIKDRGGRNVHFGIREHAMGTITNGMAIHGGLRPYAATFFLFSDYMRPAVRLAALMRAPSIFIWTHDSVFLGEDGPTHQPIEHLASLRAMPNLWVLRPADAGETVEALEIAVNRLDGPTAVVLTRQGLPVLERPAGGVGRGGYVLRDGDDVVIVATGSEVHVAAGAAELLGDEGVSARVVSLPSWEAFFAQDETYRRSVLGMGLPIVSVEAAATFGWERITGSDGLRIGIDHFGASAPAEVIAEHWGFTPEAVASRVKSWLEER
jgi:transketolase